MKFNWMWVSNLFLYRSDLVSFIEDRKIANFTDDRIQ